LLDSGASGILLLQVALLLAMGSLAPAAYATVSQSGTLSRYTILISAAASWNLLPVCIYVRGTVESVAGTVTNSAHGDGAGTQSDSVVSIADEAMQVTDDGAINAVR
jgi:hypothetical protein